MSNLGGAPTQGSRGEFSLDGYENLTEIGRGGFSVVFRAWQADLNRWVAIKTVPIAEGGASLSQSTRERLAIGTLSGHPNIVTVYDAGVTPNRISFIAMEYLPDGTLADRLRRGPLEWSDVAIVGIKLGAALESAHRSGVLHLDVKPENVFLSGDYDAVKLGDFGIASVEGKPETARGTISGTLLHMAPERLQDQPPTVASDVYSLGSTLFTLVFGRPPFGRAGEAAGVVIARILGERPALPRTGSPELPVSFGRVLEQALAADPGDRQASTREVGEQLRAVQAEAGLVPTPMLVKVSRGNGPPTNPSGGRPGPAGEETLPPKPTPSDIADGDPSPRERRTRPRPRVSTMIGGLSGLLLAIVIGAGVLRAGPFRSSPPPRGVGATTQAPSPPDERRPTVRDDFSNVSTGWTNTVDDAFYDGEGGYRIRVKGDRTRRAAGPREADPDVTALATQGVNVRVEVDASALSRTLVGMGLFCRQQAGSKERYQGVVFPDGRWLITRDPSGSSRILKSGQTTLPSGDVQHIGLECIDDGRGLTMLRLRVGGETVGESSESDGLKGGGMGIVAVTGNAPTGEVLFDNFVAATL